jgi:Rieske Fe-S protein
LTPGDRREFLGQIAGALGAAAAAAAAPLVTACSHAAPVNLPAPGPALGTTVDIKALTSDGATMVAPVRGPDEAPILLVRDGASSFHALSLMCTHEGCPVRSTPVNGILVCPCHGSQFDLAGNVVQGPADLPLGRYETHYEPTTHLLTVRFSASK